jgi:HEAT repeat protein
MLRGRWIVAAAGAVLVACGTSGVVRTALHGDLAALKREVSEGQRRGDLDRGTVIDLAQAVAGREVRSAKGQGAIHQIRAIRSCASSLLPVLRDKAEQGDDAGAEATMLLYDLGRLPAEPLVRRHRAASAGAWRAVAARAAVAPKYGLLRRQWMRDPDERVRRAALAAALDSAGRDDLEELLEAARLEPDEIGRSLALRAVGAIGGERAVLALDDLWARADETTRKAIVDAWAMPAAYETGGRGRLIRVVETTRGIAALAAAEALSRTSGPEAHKGVAVLTRAIVDGTPEERSVAIVAAPLHDSDVVQALRRSAKERDREVRVMALARLVEVQEHRLEAVKALQQLAAKQDEIAVQARAALSAADDKSVVPGLEKQLSSRRSQDRKLAALGLLRLGEWPRLATALADDDPHVRASVACTVLSREAADGS